MGRRRITVANHAMGLLLALVVATTIVLILMALAA